MRQRIVFTCVILAIGPSALGQEKAARRYPPDLPGAKVVTYKTVGDTKLNLWIYEPEGHKPEDKSPAIVFFFGGGWTNGSPQQFEQQCKHLAGRGMVAITADYRVASRNQVKAISCVADAKSAVRYVRQNAARLGIDPNRIAAGGGSAGGHLAACTAALKGFDEAGEDASVSSMPNALALFNPAVVLAPVEGVRQLDAGKVNSFRDKMGADPIELSPYHHVHRGMPPTIVFHGKADSTVW